MDYSSRSQLAGLVNSTCIIAGLAVVFLAAQCIAAESVADDVVEFETTRCWVEVDSRAGTDCGWLMVPEDWDDRQAAKLKLPVVIYRALNPDTSLSPVIYLAGGPGGQALGPNGQYMARWRSTADIVFPGRTLIIFDQRGTGLGSPKLECHDGDGPMVWSPVSKNPENFGDSASRVHTAYAACAARHLAAGRQLSAFNTVQSAADVEALRRALKLRDVILFGISYGTRLALTVMKLYPDNISAAILDSVLPPQAVYSDFDSKIFGAVLERLFQACHQDESCRAAYPDLRGRFLRVLKQLADAPVIIEITSLELTDLGDREPLYVRIDHRMFLSVIRSEMYHTDRLLNLPVLISGVAQGEYWRLKAHVENTVYSNFPDDYDMGATLAVSCNDAVGAANQQPAVNSSKSYHYLNDFVASAQNSWPCAVWPTKPTTGNSDAVASDIPTLLLAGGLDPATTVEHAEMAAETLRVSHIFIFPANGHVQIRDNECSWEVIDEFLSDPRRRPNPKCLITLRQPAFLAYGGN